MKKLIILSAVTGALLLATEQQASAWSNIKFGAGVSLHWQTGDNNLLWGVFRNGQIPHPYGGFTGGYGGHGGHGGYGQQYMPYPISTDSGNSVSTPSQTPDASSTNKGQASQVNYANPYGNYGYQPVGYYQNYSAPAANYSYYSYQVPYYWYGN